MDVDVQLPSKLLSSFSICADVLKRHCHVQIISHYDADGIAAAGIIANALLRQGKSVHVRLHKALNQKGAEAIASSGEACTIITDMGASYLGTLFSSENDVIVLDHHQNEELHEDRPYVNPHNHGIDGMTSACASSLAMMLAVEMDETNWDLVQLAFAGIAGDRQHVNGVTGVNAHLLKEGIARSHLRLQEGSLIPPGELRSALYHSTDPYIVGVSSDPEGVDALLKQAGVPPGTKDSDLDPQSRRRLSSLIALRLMSQGVSLATLREVSRTRYSLPSWGVDAEELASLLNACGRKDQEGLGIAVALGDGDARKEADAMRIEYMDEVVRSVKDLEVQGLQEMDGIQYFHSPSSGYTGIVCGVAMQYLGDSRLPCFGLSRKETSVRISGRGTNEQLAEGIDLAVALRDASASVGGSGGGHRIASGAAVPLEREEEFLNNLNGIILAQRSGAK